MGMGMLFAGALTGAGNALGSMADDAIKREDEQRKYQMAVQERRDALLHEMEMKEKFARRVEQADAQSYERAVGAAQQAGDDRRFAKFSTDMAQSGYGEGMDDAQKRAIFEQHYNDKVVSDEVGGARYYEPESADKADILSEMRRGGASGAAIKTAREDYTTQLKAEQASADAVRKERSERAREDLRSRQLDQQWAISEARLAAQQGNRDAREMPKPGSLTDVQKARLKPLESELSAAMSESKEAAANKSLPSSKRAAIQERLDAAMKAYNSALDGMGGAPASQPPKSSAGAAKMATIPVAQVPPEQRKVGDKAIAKDGREVRWDGKGWKY